MMGEDRICRGCLRSSGGARNLDARAARSFYDLCKVKLEKDSGLPYKLCVPCYSGFRRAARFRWVCRQADGTLQRWAQTQKEDSKRIDLNSFLHTQKTSHSEDSLTRSSLLIIQCTDTALNTSDVQIYTHCCVSETSADPLLNLKHDKNEITSTVNNEHILKDEQINCSVKDEVGDPNLELHEFIDVRDVKVEEEAASENDANFVDEPESDNDEFLVNYVRARRKSRRRLGNVCYEQDGTNIVLNKEGGGTDSEKINDLDVADIFPSGNRRKKKKKQMIERKNEREKKRVIYYPYDPSKARLVKQSEEQQRAELERLRHSDRFLGAPYHCLPCAKYYMTETSLDSHEKRHKESAGPYLCPVCTQRYGTPRALRMHTLTHVDRYACARCPAVFCSRSAVIKHAAGHDGALHTFVCSTCGKISTCISTHKKHERAHFKLRPYKCEQCPKDFTNSTSRNIHVMRAHTNVRHFSCSDCPKSFVNRTALLAHAARHSSAREHYCVECDARFKTASSLKSHLTCTARHALPSTLKFACEECGARYATGHRLREHALSAHVRDSRHVCPVCERTYHTAGALRRHRFLKHLGGETERRFKCTTCDKAFTTRVILKHHTMIHTGERPYGCKACDKTFRHTAALWTHNKLVHKRPKLKV